MTSIATPPAGAVPAAAPTPRLVGGIAVAALGAVVVNALLALALSALLTGPAVGLEPAMAWISMSIVGVLIGTAGWVAVRRLAARPAALLRVLVPVALVVSWIPDAVVLAGGAGVLNVVGLALMHAVVAAACVAVLPRVLPVR
ncbi:hypothetical protein Acsp06_12400 [Actinomycetospora sp. NBRC 106375]|uniref:hypothetical protein n=1 Tax=Actinomycetospora sp. NBRC 106375 TaxID=3032207 RepID=UPI0024A1E72B|nr:hypothetical protein [Actinomycetospora sp. NBRC 106375]GLZ45055.1 hypothetical protein Acsp06_12400 [Actinomycetospora sp. NBRC 106375]